MKFQAASCISILLGGITCVPAQSQAFTFFGIPWGITRAGVEARLNTVGIIPTQDHGSGRIEYRADSSRVFASFDGDRLVGIQENYEIIDPAGAMNLFRVLEDSLTRTMGAVDSTGLQIRVWKGSRTGERLSLELYVPAQVSDSVLPTIYLSRQGPGYALFWNRFMNHFVTDLRNQLYGWIFERAPADRWELVFSQNDRGVLFERARARRTSSGTWRVWMRTVLRSPVVTRFGTQYDLLMSESEIDCIGRRTRDYETVLYLRESVVDSEGMSTWRRWLPESVGEGMYEGFCRQMQRR